ncbi:barH-like 1 homeobox protein [Phoenicopterus ruber ruber]
MMQLSAATWSGDDSELNLAPGQVALSSANYRVQRLGGCNNHLKGEIKAPLNGVLCSRPHLIRGGFSERGAPAVTAEPAGMEKGPFSVEWLAQSSRGGAQPIAAARRPRSPPGDTGSQESPADLAALRDREAADRSSPGHEAEAGGGAAPGRPRTKFSAAQLQELERSFREQRYIGASEKRRLAAVLNLSQSQIKTWFQNRRMKFKRQTQDARVEALFSGLFLPYHCYPDIATSSCSHGMDVNVSSTSTVSLHPAMPSPALLLPSVPAQSLQPLLPSPALLLTPSPGLSCYSSVIPAMALTDDHKRLRFQPYLPSC